VPKIVENLRAVGTQPGTPLGSSQRSPRPPSWWGTSPPLSAFGIDSRPFGLAPSPNEKSRSRTCLASRLGLIGTYQADGFVGDGSYAAVTTSNRLRFDLVSTAFDGRSTAYQTSRRSQ